MSFIIFPGVITPPLTPGAVPYGTGSQVLMSAQGTAGQVLISGGGAAPTWSTGAVIPTPLTAGGVVYGTGTAVAVSAAGTAGQILQSTGAGAPVWATAAGDVVGPSSATDNAIARFDTTTGKLIQNSAATVADTSGTITNAGEYVAAGGSVSTVAFGSTTGTTDTGIFFPGADIVGLSSAGVERMRIPAAGGVQAVTTISVGNATPAASGAGVTFPATQSASTNANTLDDYEEGSWTPADGSGAGLTITNSGATYIKVGRLVTIFAFLSYPATANGNNTAISGLPYATSAIEYGEMIARTTAAITAMVFQPNAGGTTGVFQLSASNTSVTNNQLSGASILFCGSYFASS